jgi:hypothetical protein
MDVGDFPKSEATGQPQRGRVPRLGAAVEVFDSPASQLNEHAPTNLRRQPTTAKLLMNHDVFRPGVAGGKCSLQSQ